jgi:DNA mismatch repair protein MSH3
VDELDSADIDARHGAPPLVCVVEQLAGGMGTDERVRIAFVAVTPSTGDVVWDEFDGAPQLLLCRGSYRLMVLDRRTYAY